VKGKLTPISVWGIEENSGVTVRDALSAGYEEQKQLLNKAYMCWKTEGQKATCIIEGQSGMGKSNLLNWCVQMINNDDLSFW
jgi:putative ribosome biogenesis GTPase RsgA